MIRVFNVAVALLILVPLAKQHKVNEKTKTDSIPALVNSINAYRAQHGLPAMIYSPELQAAAKRHASDMARHNSLNHAGTDGSSFSQRARAAGFPMAGGGEIIAQGSEGEAVSMWSRSPGHNAQMLGNCRYIGACGVGEYSCAVFGDK
jgi:uncharacterized protein YkwD